MHFACTPARDPNYVRFKLVRCARLMLNTFSDYRLYIEYAQAQLYAWEDYSPMLLFDPSLWEINRITSLVFNSTLHRTCTRTTIRLWTGSSPVYAAIAQQQQRRCIHWRSSTCGISQQLWLTASIVLAASAPDLEPPRANKWRQYTWRPSMCNMVDAGNSRKYGAVRWYNLSQKPATTLNKGLWLKDCNETPPCWRPAWVSTATLSLQTF